jgi:hypothetical protein
MKRGVLFAVTGKFSDAVKLLTAEIMVWRVMGITFLVPAYLSFLATAYVGLDQFNEAWRCIQEAMTIIDKTKEKWWEAASTTSQVLGTPRRNEPRAPLA